MALTLSRNAWVGLGKETTIGTPVNPTIWLPVEPNVKGVDIPQYVEDKSLFGSRAAVRGLYQGEKDATFDFGGFLFPDHVGTLMVAAGLADTMASPRSVTDGVTTNTSPNITSATAAWTQADVGSAITGAGIPAGTTILSVQSATAATLSQSATATGSAITFNIGTTGTYRHRFALTTSQPPTWTAMLWNGVDYRQWPGLMLDSLDITITAKGAIKYAAKFKGWPSVIGSSQTPAFPASAALLGWEALMTVGGSSVSRFIEETISIKQNAETVHTMSGVQTPYTSWGADLDVDIKAKATFENDIEFNHATNNDQPAMVTTITTPSSGPVVTFTSNKAGWKQAPVDHSGKYQITDADIKGIYNASDGAALSALVTNTVNVAY